MQWKDGAELLGRTQALTQLVMSLLVEDMAHPDGPSSLQESMDELADSVTMLVQLAEKHGAAAAEPACEALNIAAWALRYVLTFMDDAHGPTLQKMVQP